MNQNQNAFEFEGLWCFLTSESPLTYQFIPNQPYPEANAAGQPSLLSIPTPQGGLLQFGVRLLPPAETIEALRQELAKRHGLADANLIQLSVAPLTVEAVRIMIGDGSGNFTEASRKQSSGFPPYNALFRLQLDQKQQANVSAVLKGQMGFLVIHYDIIRSVPVTTTVNLRGNVQRLLERMPDLSLENDPDLIRTLIQQAIEDGELIVEINAFSDTPVELWQRVEASVIEKAIGIIDQMKREQKAPTNKTEFGFSYSLTENLAKPLELIGDMAAWFKTGTGPDHIITVAGTGNNNS